MPHSPHRPWTRQVVAGLTLVVGLFLIPRAASGQG